MTTLYIDRKNISLKIASKALRIYENEQYKSSVPLNMIERLVLRSNVAFSSQILAQLSFANISVTLLSPRRTRYAGTLTGAPHNDVKRRIDQFCCYQNPVLKKTIALTLVIEKVAHQQRFIDQRLNTRPDKRHALLSTNRKLIERLHSLKTSGSTLTIDQIRGLEGAAAAAYFEGYTSLFAPILDFTGRNRRPPKDPVNVCLSLGYTLLHSELVRSCHSAGLDPMLGYLHDPYYGRDSLAADLIEPLRPHVDDWVWKVFRDEWLRHDHFSMDGEACLLGKAGRAHFYSGFEQLMRPMRRLIRRQVYHFIHTLNTLASTYDETPIS